MDDRKMIRESIHLGFGANLFNEFKEAWLSIPIQYRNTAEVIDSTIIYLRSETDAEYAERKKQELADAERLEEARLARAERESKMLALRNSTHLVNELHFALNNGLNSLNQEWPTISTGQGMQLTASVPMPDGRLAAIKIDVTVKEQTKNE